MPNTPSAFEDFVLRTFQEDIAAPAPAANHPDLDTLLDYQIGALPSFERAVVDAHLLRCQECRELERELAERASRSVKDLSDRAQSSSFSAWFARTTRQKPSWRFAKRFVPTLATAACSLGLFAAGLFRLLQQGQRAIPRDISVPPRWDLIGLFASAVIGSGLAIYLFIREKR